MAGKGVVVKWERIRRTNHWLDALGYACAAAHLAGVRLIDEEWPPAPKQPPSTPSPGIRRSDDSPWIDLNGWREMQRRNFG